MAASADLVVNIVTKLSGDGMDQATKSTSKFKSGLATASKVAGAALVGIGAAAISAANAAAEDAKSQALLANSMVNAAGASKAQIQATEDWIDAQSRATGVTDDELRPALGSLVRATGDVQKSQKALAVAMDVSAATGKPLQSVADAMAKGYGGNTAALSRLVPGISKAAIESGKFGRVMDEVAQKTDGAARAAGDTAAGKMARFKNALGETQEAAGAALLPVLDKLSGVLVKIGQWAQDHGTLFTVIAAGVAVMAIAIIALNTALSIYTAVTTLAGSATIAAWVAALWPILAVIAAVALVVGIVVLLWKRSQTFRTIVMAVWGAVKVAITAVGNAIRKVGAIAANVFSWIKSHWRLLAAILGGPFVAAAILIISNFQRIRSVISSVLGWIKSAWHAAWGTIRSMTSTALSGIRGVVSDLVGWVRDKWGDMVSGIRGAMNGLGAILRAPFDAVHAAIQAAISMVEKLISALGRIHVPKINLPGGLNLPGPLSVAGPAAAAAAPAVPQARAGTGRAATAGSGITVNVFGAVDPEATARQVQRILSGHNRRVGLRVS